MKKIFRFVTVSVFILLMILALPLSLKAACPISDSTDSEMTKLVEKQYSMIPKGIRSQYEKSGGSVEITDFISVSAELAQHSDNTIQIPTGNFAAGVYNPNTNDIFLTDFCASSAICHEIGHFADIKCMGNTSQTKAFNKIYKAEAKVFDNGENDYASSDSQEYFAEAFSEYVTCAGYLKKTVPKTYNYIDALMKSYGGTTTNKITVKTDDEYHIVDVIPTKKLKELANEVKDGAIKVLPDNIASALKKYGLSEEEIEALKKAIDENPEKAGKEMGDKLSEDLAGIDWGKIQGNSRQSANDIVDKINKLVE